MRRIVAEKIADQVHDWGHNGLVDGDLLSRLLARYSTDVTLGRDILNIVVVRHYIFI